MEAVETAPCTIFYSWQSQLPSKENRNFIEDALERAAKSIRNDSTVEALPEVDQGAANVPGAPNIADAILAKIDSARAVAFDVSLVPPGDGPHARPAPNANVLVELGYAVKAIGYERIVLVMNTAYGGPEQLPFDLRQRHVVTYTLPAGVADKGEVRKALMSRLEGKLRDVLRVPPARAPAPSPPVELSLRYEARQQDQHLHRYLLKIKLRNVGKKRLDDWYVEVEMPTAVLEGREAQGGFVRERSDSRTSLFRMSTQRPLLVGDEYNADLRYHVDTELYYEQHAVIDSWRAKARACIDGELVAEAQLAKLQNF
jgi:hypothetical protein